MNPRLVDLMELHLKDFSIEQIVEHVATWPTSDETDETDQPDIIDDWVKLARQIRWRDRRAAFHVVPSVTVLDPPTPTAD